MRSKYKEEYCQQVIDYMTKGNSLVQFAALIGVSKATVYEWQKEHPEFEAAYKEAYSKAESFWEKIAQGRALKKIEANDTMLIFYLKNRFRWSDRLAQEINSTAKITFTSSIGDDGSVTRDEDSSD